MSIPSSAIPSAISDSGVPIIRIPASARLLAMEKVVFPGMLGLVTRIELVRHELGDEVRRHLDVGVDGDATAQLSLVVVVGRPGLVGNEVEDVRLTLG